MWVITRDISGADVRYNRVKTVSTILDSLQVELEDGSSLSAAENQSRIIVGFATDVEAAAALNLMLDELAKMSEIVRNKLAGKGVSQRLTE